MRKVTVGIVLFALHVCSYADIVSTYNVGQEKLTLSHRDDTHIRLDRNSVGHFVIDGSKAAGVLTQGTNKVVLNTEQMAALLAGANGEQQVAIPNTQNVKLTDTGTFRQVAGISGRVFQLTDGRGAYQVVLTDHPRVVAASNALLQVIRHFATAMGNQNGARILALDVAFRNHPYRGVLAVDGTMTMTSIADLPRPASFYQVPQTTLNFPFQDMLK